MSVKIEEGTSDRKLFYYKCLKNHTNSAYGIFREGVIYRFLTHKRAEGSRWVELSATEYLIEKYKKRTYVSDFIGR